MRLNFQAKARVLTIYSVFVDSPLRNEGWSGLSPEDIRMGLSREDTQGLASAVRTWSCSQMRFHTLTGPLKWLNYLLHMPLFFHWECGWHFSPGISWSIRWDMCLCGAQVPEALPSWHPGFCVCDGEALPHSYLSPEQQEHEEGCSAASLLLASSVPDPVPALMPCPLDKHFLNSI